MPNPKRDAASVFASLLTPGIKVKVISKPHYMGRDDRESRFNDGHPIIGATGVVFGEVPAPNV